jgi:hypothetical protein
MLDMEISLGNRLGLAFDRVGPISPLTLVYYPLSPIKVI